jgi:hypothetical protein
MALPDFRRDLHTLQGNELRSRIVVYAHELNLLLKLAAARELGIRVDLVERDGFTEVLVEPENT